MSPPHASLRIKCHHNKGTTRHIATAFAPPPQTGMNTTGGTCPGRDTGTICSTARHACMGARTSATAGATMGTSTRTIIGACIGTSIGTVFVAQCLGSFVVLATRTPPESSSCFRLVSTASRTFRQKSSQQCAPITEDDSSTQRTDYKQHSCLWWEEEFLSGPHTDLEVEMLKTAKTSEEQGTLETDWWMMRTSQRVVIEHDIQHLPQGSGKPRVKFDHALHARMWTSITNTDEHTRARKMDSFEFSFKMERRRNRTFAKCEAEWDNLKANPCVERDEKGAAVDHRSVEELVEFFCQADEDEPHPWNGRQTLAYLRCGHQVDEPHNSAATLGFASLAESSQSAAGLTNKV